MRVLCRVLGDRAPHQGRRCHTFRAPWPRSHPCPPFRLGPGLLPGVPCGASLTLGFSCVLGAQCIGRGKGGNLLRYRSSPPIIVVAPVPLFSLSFPPSSVLAARNCGGCTRGWCACFLPVSCNLPAGTCGVTPVDKAVPPQRRLLGALQQAPQPLPTSKGASPRLAHVPRRVVARCLEPC